jgi:hypothetical protein
VLQAWQVQGQLWLQLQVLVQKGEPQGQPPQQLLVYPANGQRQEDESVTLDTQTLCQYVQGKHKKVGLIPEK